MQHTATGENVLLFGSDSALSISSGFIEIPAHSLCDDTCLFAGCLSHLLVHQTLDSAFHMGSKLQQWH
jgi:hypothetical protein